MKKIIVILTSMFLSNFILGQQIDIHRYNSQISDTSIFFEMDLKLIGNIDNKKKIDLTNLEANPILSAIYRFHDKTVSIHCNNVIDKYPIRITDQDEWSISVETGEIRESYILVPIFVNEKYVVMNVISTKRKRILAKGYFQKYSSTFVFSIEK